MGWVLAAALLFSSPLPDFITDIEAGEGALPSRAIDVGTAVVEGREPASFDLMDLRDDEAVRTAAQIDHPSHSIFGFKRHVGLAGGYDNENVHGSIGWYLTVAEWGRWNFGVPSPALGFGRYGKYDARRQQVVTTTNYTIVISLASVHYRAGHIRSLDMNWYVNVEQIFDVIGNMPGSQIGISLSRK